MSKIKRIKYFTAERKKLISKENIKLYDRYLRSNIIKNKEVQDTTYKVYKNYMDHFLVFIAENYDNISLYSEEMMEEAVDILEDFIGFCQNTLHNNKKVINTKLSAISSFYLWSLKRGLIDRHPFDKKLDRMKGANEEKIINSYFLDDEQIEQISNGLKEDKRYDIQDRLIWEIMLSSANRVGAISRLTLTSLDMDNMMFTNIREKRGYRVEVVFSQEALELIELWLEERKELDDLTVDSLLITLYGGEYRPMSYSTIQERVRKIGEIIGLRDFHPHSIRKTTLNQIYKKTGDMALAAELANHKSIETTRQSYIRPQSKAEIRDKINELMKKKNEEDDNVEIEVE